MTNRSFSRALTLVSLSLWSGVLLYFYFSGRLNHYLIGAYRPLAAIAGFLLLALAGVLIIAWRSDRNSPLAASEEDLMPVSASGGRSRRITQVLGFLVLVLPVATAVGVSGDTFGANTVRRRGLVTDISGLPTKAAANAPAGPAVAATTAAAPSAPLAMPEPPLPGETPIPPGAENVDVANYLPKSPEGHLILSVVDLLMAAEDDTLRPQFEGRTVEMVGQFMPDTRNNATGNRFNLVRMFMVCCAADARPVALSIQTSEPPKIAEMAWTKVIGTVEFPVQDGRRVAVVKSDRLAPSDPPAEMMLY